MGIFHWIIAASIISQVQSTWNSFYKEVNFQSEEEDTNFARDNEDPNAIVPFVRAPSGTFRGSTKFTRSGKCYFEFSAIPYAEPPRRFEPAVPKAPIDGHYDATTEPPVCPQMQEGTMQFVGQEDCLYLSVSKPCDRYCRKETADGQLLPVMFWIHPGAFLDGNGSFYQGTYLLDKCIVLVTINYRLGALGFLTTGDNIIPGNLGLKDQLLALKWTRRNIKYFRGDPNQVTIAGSSAGGSSVTQHIISPASAGLFSRAIAMSGAVLQPWGITEKPRIYAVNLAEKFLCLPTSSEAIRSCLLRPSPKAIVSKQLTASEFALHYGPVIEPRNAVNPFQNGIPYHLLKTGRINKVPLLIGFVQDEGIYFGAPIISNPVLVAGLNAGFSLVAPLELYYDQLNIPLPEVENFSESIRYFYFNVFPISNKQRQNFINLVSDRGIVQGIYETVQVISRYVPTYMYLNTYKGGISYAQLNFGYKIPVITHIDDEQYIFPKFKLWLQGTEQYEFSKDMVELWTNFMRSGKPTGRATSKVPWVRTNFDEPVYRKVFNLDQPPRIVRNLWRRRTKFWRGLGIYNYEFAEFNPPARGLCGRNYTCTD